MSDIQVKAAVKAQKAAKKQQVLTYRGVQYLKSQSKWAPAKVAI